MTPKLQTNQKQPRVGAGQVSAAIREIQVLSNEKATFCASRVPDFGVRPAAQVFFRDRIDIVSMLFQPSF
jgi:hypothetical protein